MGVIFIVIQPQFPIKIYLIDCGRNAYGQDSALKFYSRYVLLMFSDFLLPPLSHSLSLPTDFSWFEHCWNHLGLNVLLVAVKAPPYSPSSSGEAEALMEKTIKLTFF